MQVLLRVFYFGSLLLVFGALTTAIFQRLRMRSALGDIVVVNDDRSRRRLMLFVYLGFAFLGCQRLGAFGRGPLFAAGIVAVVGALALTLLPTHAGGWIGTKGVRLGWLVRPWGEVESWRLVGEHFRFLVDERWRAIPVSESERQQLRSILEKSIPDTESERA